MTNSNVFSSSRGEEPFCTLLNCQQYYARRSYGQGRATHDGAEA